TGSHGTRVHRQRALAEWAGAAGSGLIAWGLGTEAPTRARGGQEHPAEQGPVAQARQAWPGGAGYRRDASTHGRQRSRYARYDVAFSVVGMVLKVRYGLRHPRRLTVLAIADEAPDAVFYVLRAARAVQRRRPRTAAGSALAAAGSLTRLRA